MRLFEVAHNRFQDDLRNVLKVLQGRADDKDTTSIVSWFALNNMLSPYGYGQVNADILNKIKDQVDKDGELIQDVDDQKGVVLKTKVSTPEEPKPVGGNADPKSVDQMAHNAVSDLT